MSDDSTKTCRVVEIESNEWKERGTAVLAVRETRTGLSFMPVFIRNIFMRIHRHGARRGLRQVHSADHLRVKARSASGIETRIFREQAPNRRVEHEDSKYTEVGTFNGTSNVPQHQMSGVRTMEACG